MRKLPLDLLRVLCVMVPAWIAGIVYTWAARAAQGADNPFGFVELPALGAYVGRFVSQLIAGDAGQLPGNAGPVLPYLLAALPRSLWVLALAFVFSTAAGIGLAFLITRPGTRTGVFSLISALLLSVPPFLIAVMAVALILALGLNFPPVQNDWLLPVLVLALRPALQITRVLSGLIGEHYARMYVTAARSVGNDWAGVRRRHIWPNVIAPAILQSAAAFRLLIAELVVIEWLLNWPGIGRLLAQALIVPRRTDALAAFFLHPELVAWLFAILAALFVIAGIIAQRASTASDPRLRAAARRAPLAEGV
jgi:peptide/nickel transport system permease protein